MVDNGKFRDIPIREGEVYLHPGGVPHSPQRVANSVGMALIWWHAWYVVLACSNQELRCSVGLVIERARAVNEIDYLRWYCPKCQNIIHQDQFYCNDLGEWVDCCVCVCVCVTHSCHTVRYTTCTCHWPLLQEWSIASVSCVQVCGCATQSCTQAMNFGV